MSAMAPLADDAALVLGIASTALPFACTRTDEAECWLRILRLYGEAGAMLQALGVGEDRLQMPGAGGSAPDDEGRAKDEDMVARVAEEASHIAHRRAVAGLSTIDLLQAVMRVYGAHFDQALAARGIGGDEVAARLRRGDSGERNRRRRAAQALPCSGA